MLTVDRSKMPSCCPESDRMCPTPNDCGEKGTCFQSKKGLRQAVAQMDYRSDFQKPEGARRLQYDAAHPKPSETPRQFKLSSDFPRVGNGGAATPRERSDGGSTRYYDLPTGAVDLNDLIEHKGMSFAQGNIFKACYRLGEKDGTTQAYDLRKIIFFAQRMLAAAEKTT